MLPFVLSAAVSQIAPLTLTAADPVPVVVIVLTPFGSESAVGTSRFVRATAEILKKHTDLRALSAEQAGLDLRALAECPARRQLTCWSQLVNGEAARGQITFPYVFGLAVRRIRDGVDRVSITMLDAALADKYAGPSLAAEQEDLLFSTTPRTRPVRIPSAPDDALSDALEQLIVESLAQPLQKAGHWHPFGTVEMSSGCDRCEVAVDGRLVGISTDGRMRIEGLRAGVHTIDFKGSNGALKRCSVFIEPYTMTEFDIGQCEGGSEGDSKENNWIRYAGAAVGVTGAALLVYGAVQNSGSPAALCFVPAGGDSTTCGRLGAPGLGFDADAGLTG
ncbi:MAG: hypothetical protein AAF449_21100, partial [Myxococcota bacterium]